MRRLLHATLAGMGIGLFVVLISVPTYEPPPPVPRAEPIAAVLRRVAPTLSAQQPVVTAGDTLISQLSTGSGTDEFAVAAAPATLLIVSGRNAHASADAFVKCTNNTTAGTTPGSTAIVFETSIPFGNIPIAVPVYAKFSVAVTCYITTSKTASGTVAVAADDVRVNYTYRLD